MTTSNRHGSTTQVTVDRVSNSGNRIAKETVGGKTIHVPAGAVGDTYEVKLIERDGYFVAELVDRAAEVQPRSPSIGSTTAELDLSRESGDTHSYEILDAPAGGRLRGEPGQEDAKAKRHWMARRKL